MQHWRSRIFAFEAQLDHLAAQLHKFNQPMLLWMLALCQAATILATWRLWQIHRSPPMLPALPLPEINTGVILLVTLAGIFVRPLQALVLHTVVTTYAIAIDQTRLQPEIVSLLILMWGSLGWNSLRTVARAHLISLWFCSGLNKLLSSGYRSSITFPAQSYGARGRSLILPLIEIVLAVLVCIPRTRKAGALLGGALHLVILAALVRGRQNSAVWAWNVGLAVAAFALFYSWRDSAARSLKKSNRWAAAAALLILILPLGFYVGVGDPYLAHNLYTNNTPVGLWLHANGDRENLQTWKHFNVPIPPQHRLFEQYFQQVCQPGDYLVIQDSRYWAALRGYSERALPCAR